MDKGNEKNGSVTNRVGKRPNWGGGFVTRGSSMLLIVA